MTAFTRFIALGDSMTEGMCDELVDGKYRGWADRTADTLAKANPNFTYINLIHSKSIPNHFILFLIFQFFIQPIFYSQLHFISLNFN